MGLIPRARACRRADTKHLSYKHLAHSSITSIPFPCFCSTRVGFHSESHTNSWSSLRFCFCLGYTSQECPTSSTHPSVRPSICPSIHHPSVHPSVRLYLPFSDLCLIHPCRPTSSQKYSLISSTPLDPPHFCQFLIVFNTSFSTKLYNDLDFSLNHFEDVNLVVSVRL